ncbi:P68 family surface lipoprotein [Mycoplasmopsis agalactiae]|uniref:P68 family surface lipoprotein n=1 Tax=Mycoplasmopsis agalactiae TaxID=2110 RepID=UPI001F1B3C96|nr:hypothetical protein [Mycoplasmopsis agalactiae]
MFGIIPLMAAAPMIAASCQKSEKSVVFQFAQSNVWPLPKMLVPLVEYYNKTFSKDKDFLPVKLQFSDVTKTTSEFELIKKVKNDIESNNESSLPSLILGAQSGAYVLNQYKRLMDLSDYGITKPIFNKNIADLHSKLPGQKGNDKIYSIPFDNLDVDAVVYNLEVLNYIFKMIKENGGNVDENADIVKKATEAGKEGVGQKLPDNTIWKALELKTADKKAFNGLSVNNETFSSIENIKEFAKKFYEGTKLNTSKVNDDTLTGEVISVDYANDLLFKELNSQIGKDKLVFDSVETGKEENPVAVKYNLVDDADIKSKFKQLLSGYKNITKRHEHKVGENNKVFQTINFGNKGENASINIARFKSAISFAASVGVNSTMFSSRNKEIYGKDDPDFEKKVAAYENVYMDPQLTTVKKDEQKIFTEGGSSLLTIKLSDESLNKATIKFVKWLFEGKNNAYIQGMEENWKTFAKYSGYIMPLASVINDQSLNWFQSEADKLKQKKSC